MSQRSMQFSHSEFNVVDVVEDAVAWARVAYRQEEIDFAIKFSRELPHRLCGVRAVLVHY